MTTRLFISPLWPMVAHLAHLMGNRQAYAKEEETFQQPIKTLTLATLSFPVVQLQLASWWNLYPQML